jgi:hypothetical protein
MRSALLVLAAVALSVGCTELANSFTVERIVLQHGARVGDLGKACALGESLTHALAALGNEGAPPHQALIIAETTAALCAEMESWEGELDSIRARRNWKALGEGRAPEMRDARLRTMRAHTESAKRFRRAWLHMQEAYGPFEGDCATIRPRDEVVYLLGLVAGLRSLLHDRAGGGHVGVPADVLGEVSRAARCLDNETWWHGPGVLEAAAWAVIPGTGPEGVDPWEVLRDEAAAGADSGVRVAYALYVLLAGNAGRTADVEAGILGFAKSVAETPQHPDWRLLDEYARQVVRHESDRLWTQDRGHRTETLGELPRPKPAPTEDEDPFGADPFAAPETEAAE